MGLRIRSVREAVGLLFGLGAAACTAGTSAPRPGDEANANASVVSCTGLYGKTPAPDGEYDGTSFGCWVDASGNAHSDSGDNCIPACLSQAKQTLCAGMSGPTCERSVNWYAADAA